MQRTPPPIPPDYYWHHFRTVVGTALEFHGHLFDDDERACIASLFELSPAAQQLFVRLLGRKGELFRRARVAYPEIGDLDGPIEELRVAGFLEVDPVPDLCDGTAMSLLTLPELRAMAADLGLPKSGRKAEVLERLEDVDADSLTARVAAADQFLRPQNTDPFLLARVVFFGNRHQDQTEFVLVDIEQSAFHDYPVDRAAPLFPDRDALADYLRAAARWDEAWEAWEAGDLDALATLAWAARDDLERRPALPPMRRRVDPGRYDERVLMLAARELERAGVQDSAIVVYSEMVNSPRSAVRAAAAADRLGLCLQRTGDADQLPALVEPLLDSPALDDISRHRVLRRLFLAKCGDDPRADIRRPDVQRLEIPGAGHAGSKALYRMGDEAVPVEEAALYALGLEGMWCENALYTTLCGLLTWDVHFAPLPGAFQHLFQDAPLDHGSETYWSARRDLFVARMAHLATADLADEVVRAYVAQQPRRCRGVAWEYFDAETLRRATAALGPGVLPIVDRIARHPRRHRRGLPDLFCFDGERALLIEVKGPGDQVSVEQALWHDFLLRSGVPTRIARVTRTD